MAIVPSNVLSNLRKEERQVVNLNALYCVTGTSNFRRAKVENISVYGIYLRLKEDISVGTKLDVMFVSEGKSDEVLVCIEILHHVKDGYGCRVISENTFESMVK